MLSSQDKALLRHVRERVDVMRACVTPEYVEAVEEMDRLGGIHLLYDGINAERQVAYCRAGRNEPSITPIWEYMDAVELSHSVLDLDDATHLGHWSNGKRDGDFWYVARDLYRSPNGHHHELVEGGAATRYGVKEREGNGTVEGSWVLPLLAHRVDEWHQDYDH